MATNKLPEWAVVGAEVWLEPSTFGTSVYRPAKVTRVTKSSVFAAGKDGREIRFVPTGWRDDERLEEYGNRGERWMRHAAYLHAKDSKHVAGGLAAGLRQDAFNKAKREVTAFSAKQPADAREAAVASIAALQAFLKAF
jgi:hypothetical protein